MKIGIIGYGTMGKAIEKIAKQRNHEVVSIIDSGDSAFDKAVDCYIDFSTANALSENIKQVCALQIPLVIGTTGWRSNFEKYKNLFIQYNNKGIWGSNFSLGVNIFMSIIEDASKKFSQFSDTYDVFLHEFHHKNKMDSPSGTALKIASLVKDNFKAKSDIQTEKLDRKVKAEELHVTSTRGGYVPGTHQVIFDSASDSIELIDRARNREGFALGSVIAAENIAQAPMGLSDFYDIFKQVYK